MAAADDATIPELLSILHRGSRKEGESAAQPSAKLASGKSGELEGKDASAAESPGKPPSLGRLVCLSRPEWAALFRAFLIAVVCTGLDLLVPKASAIMYDVLLVPGMAEADIYGVLHFDIGDDKGRELLRFTILILILRAVSFVLGVVKAITFGIVAERVVARMRLQLFSAILSQDMGFFDLRTSGELSSRLGPDALAVQMVATIAIPDFVLGVIKISVAAVMMFWQSWELGLMVMGLVPLVALYALPFSCVVMRLNREYQDAIAVSSNIATQSIGNLRVVRAFGAEDFAAALYGYAVGDPNIPGACCWWPKKIRNVYRFGVIKAILQQLLIQGSIALGSTGINAISWYGYNMVIDSQITYGTFGAFLLYAMTVGFNTGMVIKTVVGVTNAMGASQRIFEIMDRKPAIPTSGGDVPENIVGELAFEDVSFRYPSRPDVQVLSSISFFVPARSKAAFVGSSGSGKTTVLALLQRLYDVSGGRVLIDKYDVRKFDVRSLRRRIGMVQQEPVLFGFSIRENIRLGRTARGVAEGTADASEEDMIAAARQADAHDFITAFPEGYDTLVGERGVRLSGGQQQRIAIARTVLCDPPIMLLDEATSALDSASEHRVQKALERMMKDRTVLIVAHRLSTVIDADQIVVMEKEGILDSGKHGELLERCEKYRELTQRQMIQRKGGEVHSQAATDAEEALEMEKAPEALETEKAPLEALQVEAAQVASKTTLPCGPRKLDDAELERIVMMSNVDSSKKTESEATKGKPERKPALTVGFAWKLIRPEFPVLVLMLMLTLCCTGVEAWLPILQGDVVNYVVGWSYAIDQKKTETARLMILLLELNVAIQAWHYIRVIVSGIAAERVVARVRHFVFVAILKQDMGFFDTQTSGALASRLTSDTMMIHAAAASGFMETFIGIARAGAALVMSFRACWQLSCLALAIGPVMGCIMCLPAGWLIRVSIKHTDALARSMNVATETTGNMRTVISFGSEDFLDLLHGSAIGNINGPGVVCWWPTRSNNTYRYGAQRAVAMRVTMQVAIWCALSIMSLILWYGFHLIHVGEITFGDLMSFTLYTTNIAMGFGSLAGGIASTIAARAALQRIFEIASREPSLQNNGGARPAELETEIHFKDVSFSYPSRPDVRVLQGLSFVLPANSTTAFVGASGCGKSTVMSLLQRLYTPSSGCITVGGHDVTTLDASWLRRRVGVVQQQPVLFGFNICENIAYGHHALRHLEGGPVVTDTEIREVSKMANAHTFISQFPEGYQTLVGERGITLSGGQKQRVAIARAMLTQPRILLLDEATSALDAESEYLVQEAIDVAMKNRTVLMVAHRLSTVQNADQIIMMAGGRLVDSGPHQELFARCEQYQELVKHQMYARRR